MLKSVTSIVNLLRVLVLDAEFCQMHFLYLVVEHKILCSMNVMYPIYCVCVEPFCISDTLVSIVLYCVCSV